MSHRKLEHFDLTTKTAMMIIIGLTTSCEIIQIEMTDSRKYMKEQIILPMISFYSLCIKYLSIWSFYFSNLLRDYVPIKR